ncbi:hypothetical protein RQP46_004058 [Phenoliferia psychrophenolica]
MLAPTSFTAFEKGLPASTNPPSPSGSGSSTPYLNNVGKPSRLAILTSGGDCSGMNAAVRAVVKMGIARGCEVYVVREGWEGLVRGNTAPETTATPKATPERRRGGFVPTYGEGELLKEGEGEQTLKDRYIIRVGWDDVRGFASVGGTLIGTARCAAFRETEGRRKAALNLVKHGIDALVVCGGDGSLTGADRLRAEWPDHLDALVKSGDITPEQFLSNKHLNIVGLVGSIDNDMAGTDMTIGATSALHRICEAVDSISSTASSHSRAFVIEVMGRNCGWLALMAAISTGADYVFIPERPPTAEDWQSSMCAVLGRHRKEGKRKTIVIVAEGAQDCNLKPITANEIKDVLTERLGLDTRVTTLGHTQRGGAPAAYDRILATLQGAEAVEAVLTATPDKPSPVIGIRENKITSEPLMEAVQQTQEVAKMIAAKDFNAAVGLRDPEFADCLHAFRATTRLNDTYVVPPQNRMRIGIIHTGAPAGGMNAATRTAVRYCLCHGHTPVAIYNGFVGLLEGNVAELSWLRVDQWTTRGGSELGTNRTLPDTDLEGVAAKLAEYKIDGLFIVGGFEAMVSLDHLEKGRAAYKALRIPLVHLPATISNNVPITEWSIGSDTSINVLVEACDAIKQSASASRNRVFVVETQGAGCGYIAVLGALATGANLVYTPEIGITLKGLQQDVEFLKKRYQQDVPGKSEGRLVIRSEHASKTYTTQVVTDILAEEGDHLFDSRSVSLGHTLQGGIPSPRDRTRAVRLAVKCIDFLEKHFNRGLEGYELDPIDPDVATIVIEGPGIRFAGVKEMVHQADFKNRRGKTAWWAPMVDMVALMSGRVDLNAKPNAAVAAGTRPLEAGSSSSVAAEPPKKKPTVAQRRREAEKAAAAEAAGLCSLDHEQFGDAIKDCLALEKYEVQRMCIPMAMDVKCFRNLFGDNGVLISPAVYDDSSEVVVARLNNAQAGTIWGVSKIKNGNRYSSVHLASMVVILWPKKRRAEALANHALLPRDGRNITLPILTTALKQGLNVGADFTKVIGTLAIKGAKEPGATSFDLDDLAKVAVPNHEKTISLGAAAAGRWARVKASNQSNPNFHYNLKELSLERLPYIEGWRPSHAETNLLTLPPMIFRIKAANPPEASEAEEGGLVETVMDLLFKKEVPGTLPCWHGSEGCKA